MTIQEHIDNIRRESMNDITPDRAVMLLQKLSALLGSVFEEWISAEMEYNRLFEKMSNSILKITEARVKSRATQEYENKLRKEALLETTKELINSYKYLIKVKTIEARESRFQ